jgi:hypothetical protein
MQEQRHNPYAAPATLASEASTSPERLVRIAVGFYVASFLFVLASAALAALEPEPALDDRTRVAVGIALAAMCAVMALFTAFISRALLRGRRGARWWLAGGAVLWVVILIWPGTPWDDFGWENAVDLAGTLARITAGAMMFLPGVPQWFARDGSRGPDSGGIREAHRGRDAASGTPLS